MRKSFSRVSFCRVLVIAIIALTVFVWTGSVLVAADKQVLTLYTLRRDSEFAVLGENQLPRILDDGLEENVDYYSEFIDLDRFTDPAYKQSFSEFLRQKYQGVRFDVVIAMQDAALEFVEANRDILFRDTSEIFLANRSGVRRSARSTGLILERNFAGTLQLIGRLQPDVKNVFVVIGAGADAPDAETARQQLQAFERGLHITYLAGLPTKDLEQRLTRLPEHSAVYYLFVSEDGAGVKFHPLSYLDRVVAAANAPTYCWVDSAMGRGIVGGSLYSQRAAIDRVGRLALRVLRGERPDDIPLTVLDLNVDQVDWQQLRRWGIDEARVPVGAVVNFRDPTTWDRYKVYILGALVLLLTQTALITGLLIQGARRRQAERRLRGSRAKLRSSYHRIRDLGARLLHAQEAERSRIARELHDDISQRMALLTMDLQLMRVPGHNETARLAADALTRAQGIAKSVHDLSHRLHPARLRLVGLVPVLDQLRIELLGSGIDIEFTHENVPAVIPSDVMLCVFRIIQESLQNAIKYSNAKAVSVHVTGSADALTLRVVDNGDGFDIDAAWGRGLGLISMVERVEAIGGTFEIRSSRGAGTTLTATVPLNVTRRRDKTSQDQGSGGSPVDVNEYRAGHQTV
jgi:signal transduction histidine kinase